MGCGRIVTTQDVQQIREARKGMRAGSAQDVQQIREARKGMRAGSAVAASGQVSLGLRMMAASYTRIQRAVGDIGERITQQTLGGHNLNTTVASNSKIYDVGSKSHVASVKTYGVGHVSLSRDTMYNYVRDLRIAAGRSQLPNDIRIFRAAAEELRQAARQANVQLPSALRDARNGRSAAAWLAQNAQIRIPDDHVEPVRQAVRSAVVRNPDTYGLPVNASYAEKAALAQQLAQKVQPMGMSTVQIEQIVDKYL